MYLHSYTGKNMSLMSTLGEMMRNLVHPPPSPWRPGYDHYSEGIVYSQYDNGDPIRELPEESKGGCEWLMGKQKSGQTVRYDVS